MKGHLAKKPNSKNWYAVIDVGMKPNGKRDQRWFPTKTHRRRGPGGAEEIMTALLSQLQAGTLPDKRDISFEKFLVELKKNHIETNLKLNTQKKHEWAESKIPVGLKKKVIRKITAIEIQKCLTELSTEEHNLTSTSIKMIYDFINMAMNKAVFWGYISQNPCVRVQPPKRNKPKKTVLTPEEISLLIQATRKTNSYLPLLFILSTGLRRGELCALRWEDIDLEKKTIQIKNSLDVIEKTIHINPTKTASGSRLIKIPTIPFRTN